VDRVEWRSDVGASAEERDRIGAAKFHHAVVLRVRSALDARAMSVRKYALSQGLNETRVRRLLAGEIVLRVEDVVRFERTLSVETLAGPR